eukprot:SAG11_NODE_13603_length_647_cov_2.127737_2_plen_115_part_01
MASRPAPRTSGSRACAPASPTATPPPAPAHRRRAVAQDKALLARGEGLRRYYEGLLTETAAAAANDPARRFRSIMGFDELTFTAAVLAAAARPEAAGVAASDGVLGGRVRRRLAA